MNNKSKCYEISMIDTSKLLTKDGFFNLCKTYGSIKNISIHRHNLENQAFIEFENENSIHNILNEKSDFPNFVKIEVSNRNPNNFGMLNYDSENDKDEDISILKNTNEISINNEESGRSIYFGPIVTGSTLIEQSTNYKLNKIKHYNLENEDLFGKPLNTSWEKIEEFEFTINNLDFNYRFENCSEGEIKVEKKLSPNIFTGWITHFINGENVQDKLQIISNDIEISDNININDLKRGMLVGAFNKDANLYGRGYVTLIAGNSVNVAMSDYGKVINTTTIKILPKKYSELPAYSFSVHTRENYVPQLEQKSYVFKVRSVCNINNRIVLIIYDKNKEIKVQIKKWKPSVEECGVPYIDFKSGSAVELLKLKDMNSAYIRSKERHHFDILFSSWNTIAAYCYKNPQYLNREPLYGEIVGIKSILNNQQFVRARIYKYLGDDIYIVKHMDNPLKESVKKSKMIELQFEQKNLPISVLKVGLKNAVSYPIQFHAKKLTEHIINTRLTARFNESNICGWKCVDLNISIVNENFNTLLVNLCEPQWLKEIPIDLTGTSNDFPDYTYLLRNKLEENSVEKMTFVMFHEGVFYMRDKTFGKSFSLLSNMIKEYCSLSLNPYLPHNDEVCLGQFPDGIWYRIISDIIKPGKLAKVHSVDLGNIAFLNSKNMKKLPLELLFHPVHVYLCILDSSIDSIDDKKLQLLQKYENTDCEFTVQKCLFAKNHYLIKCPFLEDLLK